MRGTVKHMSVVPPWLTFWTMMSTLMPASASGAKTAFATPGRSGTSTSVSLATLRSWARPRTLLRCSTSGSSLISVPGASSKELSDLDDDVVDPAELDGAGLHDLGAVLGHLEHLLIADDPQLAGVGQEARIGGVDAADVGEDLAAVGVEARRERDGGRVGAASSEGRRLGGDVRARARVASLMPWNPATMTTLPGASSARTRAGSTLAIRARPWRPSVVMPACAPGQGDGRDAERVERHRHERRALVLAGREQHVELA